MPQVHAPRFLCRRGIEYQRECILDARVGISLPFMVVACEWKNTDGERLCNQMWILISAVCWLGWPRTQASAESWPTKPLRVIVPIRGGQRHRTSFPAWSSNRSRPAWADHRGREQARRRWNNRCRPRREGDPTAIRCWPIRPPIRSRRRFFSASELSSLAGFCGGSARSASHRSCWWYPAAGDSRRPPISSALPRRSQVTQFRFGGRRRRQPI